MIGNDVVDLALSRKESNWKRKGFLQKIFTEKELLLILKAKDPEVKVWELWSRKEAAYKIFNRKTGIHSLNPIQFECAEKADFGIVTFGRNIYYTKAQITSKMIHTIAVEELYYFDAIVFLPDRVGVLKKNGVPSIYGKPVSISHHGDFEKIISIYNPNLAFSFRNSSPKL